MEDRYDISVDIGEGKDWWYVHGLATHDKVYELNKQMCDIGKTILTKNKDIMKEKKTKKMTKAEAFEYFKRKKIIAEREDANIGVQEKLFKCGIEWANGGRVPCYHSDYLIVEESGLLYHCGCDDRYWFAHYYESIYADDILSIEIVEECAKDGEDPYFGGRIKDLQEMLEDDEVLIITKTNFLTMTK